MASFSVPPNHIVWSLHSCQRLDDMQTFLHMLHIQNQLLKAQKAISTFSSHSLYLSKLTYIKQYINIEVNCIVIHKSNTTDAASGAGTGNSSEAHEFTPGF